MQRKQFISSLLPGALTLSSAKLWGKGLELHRPHSVKIPPYLKAGDVIGITCPAGFITLEEIQPSVQLMQSWGFQIESEKQWVKEALRLAAPMKNV